MLFLCEAWVLLLLLALNLISSVASACSILKVDSLARNVIKVTLTSQTGHGYSVIKDEIKCEVKFSKDESCDTSLEVFLKQIIPINDNSSEFSHTFWLNESSSSSGNTTVTVCSRLVSNDTKPQFDYISTQDVSDDIPPLISDCSIEIGGMDAVMYRLDSTFIYAFKNGTSAVITCTFTENISKKRVKWCKEAGSCTDHGIHREEMSTTFQINRCTNEGNYYAVIENDYGKTISPIFRLRMAFQNRDTDRRSVQLREGEYGIIKCNLQSSIPKAQPYHNSWSKYIQKEPKVLIATDNLFQTLDGNLIFYEVTRNDSGRYNCEVYNEVIMKAQLDCSTDVTVLEREPGIVLPPMPVKSLSDGHQPSVIAIAGDSAVLQCLFYGRPRPRVTWFKKNLNLNQILEPDERLKISNGNMTLRIDQVRKEDSDIYKCEASNSDDKSEFKMIDLVVHEKPTFDGNMNSQNATEGDNVTFVCSYKGDPAPYAEWLIDGKVVQESYGVSITAESGKNKLTLSRVTVNSSSVCCLVHNKYGEIFTYAYLKVFKPTTIKPTPDMIVTGEKSLTTTLKCEAQTDPRTYLNIKWSINDQEVENNVESAVIPRNFKNGIDSTKKSDGDGNGEDTGKNCFAKAFYNELTINCHKLTATLLISCLAWNGISSNKSSFSIVPKPIVLASAQPHPLFFQGNMWWMLSVLIVGGALGGMVLLAFAFMSHKKFLQKSRKSEMLYTQMSMHKASCSEVGSIDTSTSSRGGHHLKKDLINIISSLLIPRNSLELKKCIGNGHFGRVYLATFMHGRQIVEVVAVKTMKYKAEESEMVELFLKEAVLMKDFQHQHVLGIRGITFADDSTPMVVLPYMANGDLRNYILNPELNITILNLLMMGMQVACGMVYLSEHHFVHRDLAARNCMVNETGVVKIADFGMSRQLISSDYYRVENGKDPVPIRWMAPECLEAKIFTTKSDVWAYGVLLWELMTRGAVPYPDAENWQVATLVQNGCLLEQPPFCPNIVYTMMLHCWTQDPSERPTFEKLYEELTTVVNVVNPEVRRDSINYHNIQRTE